MEAKDGVIRAARRTVRRGPGRYELVGVQLSLPVDADETSRQLIGDKLVVRVGHHPR